MTRAAPAPPIAGYRDGEQIPDARIKDIFRQPPNVPQAFNRSALIVGPLGPGKTVLFRFHKVVHDETGGTALHINLVQDLASISQRDTIGPWATDVPSDAQHQVAGKASSLLALCIAIRLTRKRRLSLPPSWVAPCLPLGFSVHDTEVDSLIALLRKVAHSPLRDFSATFDTRPLGMFLAQIAGELHNNGSPLLLLFDRADLVPAPALFPVLDLLNQTFHYRALLATRPGHPARVFAQPCYGGVPGDHYDVWQLGSRPHDATWRTFVSDALAAQFADRFDQLADEHAQAILTFAGGSCRIAVELIADAVDSSRKGNTDLLGALNVRHINALTRVRNVMSQHQLDYGGTLTIIRRRMREQDPSISGARPLLHVERAVPNTLWTTHTPGDAFFDDALRAGALSVGEPEEWVPGVRPSVFEVPMSLIWTKKDGLEGLLDCQELPLHVKEKELLVGSHGPSKPPKVFVAYRMNVDESRALRRNFERVVRRHPELHNVGILDGARVPEGADWATEIRRRIRSATLTVADITGLRHDVVFEVGFAFGLRKVVVPIVVGNEEIRELPPWLRSRQLARYNAIDDLDGLVSTVHSYLSNPSLAATLKPSRASPGLAVWYPAADWAQDAESQFRFAARQEAMTVESIKPETPDSLVIKQATSASLLAIALDGTESDSLGHFLCGALIASPRAGQGGSLQRRIVIVVRPGLDSTRVLADSLANCQEIAHVTTDSHVRSHVQEYGRQYRQWRNRAANGKRSKKSKRSTR